VYSCSHSQCPDSVRERSRGRRVVQQFLKKNAGVHQNELQRTDKVGIQERQSMHTTRGGAKTKKIYRRSEIIRRDEMALTSAVTDIKKSYAIDSELMLGRSPETAKIPFR